MEHELLIEGLSTHFRKNGYDYTDTLPDYQIEHVQYIEPGHPHLLTHHLHAVFPRLMKLEFIRLSIRPQSLESIRQLHYLKDLMLTSRNMIADGTGLFNVINSRGNGLETLHLSGFSSLVSLDTLARLCPNLKTLRLEHCRFRPDDDSSPASFHHHQSPYQQQPCWSKLEHLELKDIPLRIDSSDWSLLTPNTLKRVVLCFTDNDTIDDNFLNQLPSARITYLALVGARQVTSKGVENLITRFSQQRDGLVPIKLVVSDSSDDIVQHRSKLEQLARNNRIRIFLH